MKKFNELVIGEATEIIGVINDVKEFIGSDKLPYLTGEICNTSGSMQIKVWQTPLSDLTVKNGEIVKLTGKLSEWKNPKNVIIKSINVEKDATSKPMIFKAQEGEYNISDVIKTAPIDLEVTYTGILSMIDNFENPTIKLVTKRLFETYKDELVKYPSAQLVHHNIKGGLLYHIATMLKLCAPMTKIYPNIKKDLLYAGVMLHDIGKVKELAVDDNGTVTEYTLEGSLVGHIGIGLMLLNKTFMELQEELSADEENTTVLDYNTLVLLEHIIASHHFSEHWGAYSKPAFLEAELIHHLDMIDSRVYQIQEVTKDLSPGEFSGTNYFLDDRRLLNPIY